MTQDIAAALGGIRERIREVCLRSGREPREVRLIAVSKKFPYQRVEQLLACGQQCFGENRVQEALDKIPQVGPSARWHLIGSLQRNKARHAVGRFELIHSVDNEKLADELDRRAGAADLVQAVLVQVNLAGEATKSGIAPDRLPELLRLVHGKEHLDLQGLMTIPPVSRGDEARGWFSQVRTLREKSQQDLGIPLPELSMGMSSDFEIAIEEGATLIRVGTALFGPRP